MKNWTLRLRKTDTEIFNDIRTGRKSVETRAATKRYLPVAAGDTLTFVCGKDRFTKTITKRFHWKSITAMLKEVPFQKIMPSVGSVENLKKAYASYPGYKEKLRKYGLLGFKLR